MSFTEGMQRGFETVSAARKRHATSKFFKKFEELTKDSEEDVPTDSIGGIDVPQDAGPGTEAAPTDTKAAVIEGAIPVTQAATQEASNKDAAIPGTVAAQAVTAPTAKTAVEAQPYAGPSDQWQGKVDAPPPPPDKRLLPPASGPAPIPQMEPVTVSASALPADAADSADSGNDPQSALPIGDLKVKIKSPERIPLGGATGKMQKSLTQGNIKELDRLAMNAARAAGDIEVYTALQKTTDSFLQGKVLSNLSSASQALSNGDLDGTEKALTKAYRFIPDGQEAKFHRSRDGTKLMVKDPWDNKDVELTPDRIQMFGMMIHNPDKWAEMVRSDRKDAQQAGQEDRRTKIMEANSATEAASQKELARANGARELMESQKFSRDEANDKFDNLYKLAMASYYGSGGKQGAGESGSLPAGMKPDDARQYGLSVSKEVEDFLMPVTPADPNNMLSKPGRGTVPAGYEVFINAKDGSLNGIGQQAKAIGGQIGIYNPGMGPAMAARAGMEAVRALVTDKAKIGVSPENSTITVMIDGQPTTMLLDPGSISALYQAHLAQTAPGPSHGPR